MNGMFPMIIPKPIGTRSSGSQSFLMAIVMKAMPMHIITRCFNVILANPVYCRNCTRLSMIVSMALSDCYDVVAQGNMIAFLNADSGYDAVGLRLYLIFHLHCFENGYRLTCLDLVTYLHIDCQYVTIKR